ncbi:type II toxin-antitoxin system PemK/MazF family toxin [Cupriavidus plantarum]|uniref:type II toxin-antitoxin system PemK/MazF family toxin n=1 Tax=Cupriavidus plantarum TaxID=942865 RepID=UPI001B11D945|nr:type II toxin-antitoxin system PemK/MazF family toxin [Cupriavidus plantarum]CAG2126838.1 hypothetical protein LMG26296_00134 [Cupriavidus plantarum]SMR67722.1 PemK-like, MazF-like toxin of type II toxin-antitoxin system [Cupriavidus plantarum]
MIVILYEEATVEAATGARIYVPLGYELHHGIDEVLLPTDPGAKNPVFFTKKFAGSPEHRWQVQSVRHQPSIDPTTYVVRLIRRAQIDQQHYLRDILAVRNKKARAVLHPWAIVEVEFGQHLSVGTSNGDIEVGKRYVDTVQLYSMPKRRLAIVTQVLQRNAEDLVQVVPVSSKQPDAADKATVEVTSQLANMADYRKPSWAICTMIQTITASRIIAPLVVNSPRRQSRDHTFRTAVRGHTRTQLKQAILYGIGAGDRAEDTERLATERAQSLQLRSEIEAMQERLRLFSLYERVAADSKLTLAEMQELFPVDAITGDTDHIL